MRKHTVKFFKSEKGFGFATRDGEDVFFHVGGYRQPVRGPRGSVNYREAHLGERADKSLYEGVVILGLEEVNGDKGIKLTTWAIEREVDDMESIYLVLEPKHEGGRIVLTPIFIGPRQEALNCASQYDECVLMEASVNDAGFVTRCEPVAAR